MLPSFAIVGLADGAVRESKERVMSAIENCGFEFPPRQITINMAPADMKKEGSAFDLPIALGLLDKNTPLIATRPFRSPHHTISDAGPIGGGPYPRPGEVSLSHHGILFLDELPEVGKPVIEKPRKPHIRARVAQGPRKTAASPSPPSPHRGPLAPTRHNASRS